MIPFFIFIATAAACAWLTYSWGGGGTTAVQALEQYTGYISATILAVAAYVSAFSLWAGRYLAVLGVMAAVGYCLCENIGIAPRVINPQAVAAFVMLAATVLYLYGSFRVQGAQQFFYPRCASPMGRRMIAGFIAVPVGFCLWWGAWHDAAEVRHKTVQASWEPVTLDRVTSGRRQMKFTALDASLSVTVASDELYDELKPAPKKPVEMQITETLKHGTIVAWSVESIDGMREFSLLESEPEKLKP